MSTYRKYPGELKHIFHSATQMHADPILMNTTKFANHSSKIYSKWQLIIVLMSVDFQCKNLCGNI